LIKRLRLCANLMWLSWHDPEWRVGQILVNAIGLTGGQGTLFYMSDEILLMYLIQYRKDLKTHGRRERVRR
jgi:hypothetical protein